MGAFAPRRPRGQRLLPRAGAFGAGLLVFAIMLPNAGEARLSAHQLEIRKECSTQLPGRSWVRGAGPCRGQVLAPAVLPPRVFISGKLGVALAADLYCRLSSTHVSQFTQMATACLPHPSPPQRLINARSNDVVEWPAGRFEPAADTGMIEVFPVGRQPDG